MSVSVCVCLRFRGTKEQEKSRRESFPCVLSSFPCVLSFFYLFSNFFLTYFRVFLGGFFFFYFEKTPVGIGIVQNVLSLPILFVFGSFVMKVLFFFFVISYNMSSPF